MAPYAPAKEDAVLAVADDGRDTDTRDSFSHVSGFLCLLGLGYGEYRCSSVDGEERKVVW